MAGKFRLIRKKKTRTVMIFVNDSQSSRKVWEMVIRFDNGRQSSTHLVMPSLISVSLPLIKGTQIDKKTPLFLKVTRKLLRVKAISAAFE